MRPEYQSFHSYIRRPDIGAAVLTPFYADVLGLSLIRPMGEMVTFWAGEDICFEIKCDDTDRGTPVDPDTAQLLPVMRSVDLEVTLARLAGHRVEPVAVDTTEHARCAWIRCPDGHLFGFQELAESSPFVADREARHRCASGPSRLRDVDALAADLHYLHRVVMHVVDVEAMSRFYSAAYGLDVLGRQGDRAIHNLGDTVLLEIAPGGRRRPAPTDRVEVADIMMTRVHDIAVFLADMSALGVAQCGETIVFPTGSKVAYLLDPEGNIFGVTERTLWGEYPEDVETERRWKSILQSRG